jgi:chromosome segregation ATPase
MTEDDEWLYDTDCDYTLTHEVLMAEINRLEGERDYWRDEARHLKADLARCKTQHEAELARSRSECEALSKALDGENEAGEWKPDPPPVDHTLDCDGRKIQPGDVLEVGNPEIERLTKERDEAVEKCRGWQARFEEQAKEEAKYKRRSGRLLRRWQRLSVRLPEIEAAIEAWKKRSRLQ